MNKEIRLLAKCTSCTCCGKIALEVRGFIDRGGGTFLPEIEGEIQFDVEKRSIAEKKFKQLKAGENYYITITPTKVKI